MIIVKTSLMEDGVIGINGYKYLLHADNTLMKFETVELAKEFLTNEGVYLEGHPSAEYIEFVDEDEETGVLIENYLDTRKN